MSEITPNPIETPAEDALANPPAVLPEGTETLDTPGGIDYEVKFKESQKEALRLLEEGKQKDIELARLRTQPDRPLETTPPTLNNDPADDIELYPGFNELDPAAQQNLMAYTDAVTRRARDDIYRDPAIAFARKTYNDQKWDTAFSKVAATFPDLSPHTEDFRSKYYNPQNVPDNVEEVIADLAKIYLFDHAKEIGAEEERKRGERIDLEDITGGDNTPTPVRSLDDWQRMARENPAEFAKHEKEFNADMNEGRI